MTEIETKIKEFIKNIFQENIKNDERFLFKAKVENSGRIAYIRPFEDEDLEFITDLYGQQYVISNVVSKPDPKKSFKDWCKEDRVMHGINKFEKYGLSSYIVENEQRKTIGIAGLTFVPLATNSGEIILAVHYAFSEAVKGQGYPFAVMRELVKVAFEGLHDILGDKAEVIARVLPENIPSQLLLCKLGFEPIKKSPVPAKSPEEKEIFYRLTYQRYQEVKGSLSLEVVVNPVNNSPLHPLATGYKPEKRSNTPAASYVSALKKDNGQQGSAKSF
ncbi:GNAT family N-acetyltransferase [Rickettsiales endosymbiont of Stachyamoeba lipophora]|uniref:GNAT family N-acetyltransferase n=1 Tax=Rickettsiales endosymbiont of Stachyamoeba lipophora TaxID=2486578 RepID=UPI000F65557D|nr:GNAT family N-acetyltransferase [Rickettsiales endosymbiont of Stachyamoeba lipophora]AZL15951.1 N-acetyltransferase [Rickettsiales endosymbiont of Stachyamoeba lipophora]